MNPSFLDTHPSSPVQSSRSSEWARSSRPGIRYVETETVCFRVREGGSLLCFVRDPDGYRIELIERPGS